MIATAESEAEALRRNLQGKLDAAKTGVHRNQLGQFATPTSLAEEMAELARKQLPDNMMVRFLDPALGTGVFFYAVKKTFGTNLLETHGYEIDEEIAGVARRLWEPLGLTVHVGDFCREIEPQEKNKANLIICNPPYVRHHHLNADRKAVLKKALATGGYCLDGLAGLYCYFLLIAHRWLSSDGVAVWIVPAEFLDVNYGKWLKRYLNADVTLIGVHRFDPHDMQFKDALVSSVILVFRNGKPNADHSVEFSSGGTLLEPQSRRLIKLNKLTSETKWGPLFDMPLGAELSAGVATPASNLTVGDLFQVKRGIATGANEFFILDRDRAETLNLPKHYLRPILPSPREIPGSIIDAKADGFPNAVPELVLIDCDLPIEKIQTEAPGLFAYLQSGKQQGIPERYLAAHRGRWYQQEQRPPAPIICTYMGRQRGGRALRFIRNRSSATAPNVYLLLYPKPHLESIIEDDSLVIERIFEALSEITDKLVPGGRVYGGGLRKIEPRELASIQLPRWVEEEYPALKQFRLERQLTHS